MEIKPIGASNRLFYYIWGGENSAFDIRVCFDMEESTDYDLLRESVAKALGNFPEFAIRPVIHEGTVWAVSNSNPVPIRPADSAPLCYGTDETAGYPFVFSSSEQGFSFSYFHGLGDFHGIWRFLRTVLFYYATGKGLDLKADELVRPESDSHMNELEQLDPYRKFSEADKASGSSAPVPAFAIPEKPYPMEETYCAIYELSCPLNKFLATAKVCKTSVAAFLSLMASKALRTLYKVNQEPIVTMISANMRKYYNTGTVVNFSDATFLRYDEEVAAMPLEAQGAALKEQLHGQMTREHFAQLIAAKTAMVDGFSRSGADICQWHKQFANHPKGPNTITVPLTYPGSLDLPGKYQPLIKKISRVMCIRNPGDFGISAETYGDTMYIRSCQRFDSPDIMLEIGKELEKNGITSAFRELPTYHGNQLIPGKLLKV